MSSMQLTQLSLQETPWASHTKRDKLPAGQRCKACALVLVRAYPGSDWASLVARARASESFRHGLVQAKAIMSGEQKARFPPAEYCENTMMGYVMERPLWFATPSEFESYFGAKHTQLGLVLEEMLDECGKPVKGIVLQNPSEPFRRLTLQNYVQTHLTKKLLQADALLRPEQADEYKALWDGDKVKGRPKGLSCPVSVATIKEQIETLRSEPAERAADQRGGARPEAPLAQVGRSTESAAENMLESDGEDTLVDDPELQQPFASSLLPQARPKKGPGKGKGNAPASKRGPGGSSVGGCSKRPRTTTNAASFPGGPSDDEGSSSGRKGSGRASVASFATNDKASDNGRLKLEQLDCDKALLGGKIRGDIYQATRVLDALETSQPGSSEAVALKARIDLVEKCGALGGSKIYSLEAATRQELVPEVCSRCESLPAAFQAALVVCAVRDVLGSPLDSVETWANIASPYARSGPVLSGACSIDRRSLPIVCPPRAVQVSQ